MKKAILLILIGAVLLSGCVAQDETEVEVASETSATLVTDIRQVNTALEKGPVLLKIGAEWCAPCREQDIIIEEMATEYEGRAAVMYIDTDMNPEFGAMFNVYSIPDSTVILDIEDGNYVYMAHDGATNVREAARFVGVADKGTLSSRLDMAIDAREQ